MDIWHVSLRLVEYRAWWSCINTLDHFFPIPHSLSPWDDPGHTCSLSSQLLLHAELLWVKDSHDSLPRKASVMASSNWATPFIHFSPNKALRLLGKPRSRSTPNLFALSTGNGFILEPYQQQKCNLKRMKYLRRATNKMLPQVKWEREYFLLGWWRKTLKMMW